MNLRAGGQFKDANAAVGLCAPAVGNAGQVAAIRGEDNMAATIGVPRQFSQYAVRGRVQKQSRLITMNSTIFIAMSGASMFITAFG